MNAERWEQHLHERIRDLELRLTVAHRRTAKQKARAELWRHRALLYQRRRKP